MDSIAITIAAVSALFAAASSVLTYFQVRSSSRSHEAAIYLQLTEQYAKPEIGDALSQLARFWRESKDLHGEAAISYAEAERSNPAEAASLRKNSRAISFYFHNAARLYQTGLLSKKATRLLINTPGLNIFYEVAAPINLAHNPSSISRDAVRTLKSILPMYGTGAF